MYHIDSTIENAYPYVAIKPDYYRYKTDSDIDYEVYFQHSLVSEDLFRGTCSKCDLIYEASWFPKPYICNVPFDIRSQLTLIDICSQFILQDYCHAIAFGYVNDKRIKGRERKIRSLITKHLTTELELFCNNQATKNMVCVIVKKSSIHYNEIIQDIKSQCLACSGMSPRPLTFRKIAVCN